MERKDNLIVEGNTVYEIDTNCMRQLKMTQNYDENHFDNKEWLLLLIILLYLY